MKGVRKERMRDRDFFYRNIFKKKLVYLAIITALLSGFFLLCICPKRVVPILMYHAINDEKSSTLNVSPKNFSRQMAFLHKSGYSVITLNALIEEIKKGKAFIPKTVVITFDDGYEDNYARAFPVLAKYNMRAIIFLITGYVGTQGYLKWDQILLMSKNNVEFGGHTRNDIYLPSEKNPQRLWDEIAGSKEDIEKKFGKKAMYFCYPVGGFNDEIKKMVKNAGYEGACTTNRGFDKLNRDVYELNRIKMTNSDMNSPFHFRAKLSGFYNIFRRMKEGE
ncbi:MAG: polysaccharide deacetylase family protein [Candidatus Omnitrophota bacterium]